MRKIYRVQVIGDQSLDFSIGCEARHFLSKVISIEEFNAISAYGEDACPTSYVPSIRITFENDWELVLNSNNPMLALYYDIQEEENTEKEIVKEDWPPYGDFGRSNGSRYPF